MLDPAFTSFVGQYPIPMRHGMTIGELARFFNERFGIGAKLEVVAMRGWSREQYFDQTGLAWVAPSPNIPTLDSAIVYPGTVLFEGTNVSEGRGTTRPFEFVGAPWVDPEPFAAGLNALGLPGVHFRAMAFEPTFHKHAGTLCGGCQIHVTDRASFRAVAVGVAVIEACKRAGPQRFAWRDPPYEYEHTKPPIDILYGSARLRAGLDRRADRREPRRRGGRRRTRLARRPPAVVALLIGPTGIIEVSGRESHASNVGVLSADRACGCWHSWPSVEPMSASPPDKAGAAGRFQRLAGPQKSPLTVNDAVIANGKKLFSSKCQRCHGASGKGDGPDGDPNHADDMNLTTASRAAANPDGVVFYKIWNGRSSPKMPTFSEELTKDQAWTIVAYVQTLRAK